MRRDGQWFETIPEPNTIMMNIGDMMQRWTADKFISTVSTDEGHTFQILTSPSEEAGLSLTVQLDSRVIEVLPDNTPL